MSTPFGDLLLRQRNALNLTQIKVCKGVTERLKKRDIDEKLTQATISAWEVGRQQPRGRTEVIEELMKLLEMKAEEVDAALAYVHPETGFAPDNIYANDVGEWAEQAKADFDASDPPVIWFIAPNVLPAFIDDSHCLLNLWHDNLIAGIQYRLFFLLGEMEREDTFRSLDTYLTELVRTLREKAMKGVEVKGKVIIYLVNRSKREDDPLSKTLSEARRDGRMLLKVLENWEKRPTKEEILPSDLIQWHRLPAFGTVVPTDRLVPSDDAIRSKINDINSDVFGRLAVYTSGAARLDTQACLLLTNTSASMNESPSRIYRWLSPESTDKTQSLIPMLEEFILDLEDWIAYRMASCQDEAGE